MRASQLNGEPIGERRVPTLPIRIGCNALNDYPLAHPGVAEFHVVIEASEGKLCVRDINSASGVLARFSAQGFATRIPPQVLVDLATCGFEFALGNSVIVRVSSEQVADAPPRASLPAGSVLGNRDLLRGPGATLMLPRAVARQRAVPGPKRHSSVPPTMPMESLADAPALFPLPRGPSGASIPNSVPGSSAPPAPMLTPVPAVRPRASSPPVSPYGFRAPSPATPPPFVPPPSSPSFVPPPGAPSALPPLAPAPTPYGSAPPAPLTNPGPDSRQAVYTSHFALPLDELALEAIRELASSLVPDRSLETTGDLARFVTKLHDMAEVFCRCFVPLRAGHAQFISTLDLQRAAEQRGVNSSPGYSAVETAQDAQELALALLDFREQALDAPKAVEAIFADLMIHQVALINGLMQGVRALFQELSPAAIEQRVAPSGTFGLDITRARALWSAYSERYAELAEDEQALARIFGTEFSESYRAYRNTSEPRDKP